LQAIGKSEFKEILQIINLSWLSYLQACATNTTQEKSLEFIVNKFW